MGYRILAVLSYALGSVASAGALLFIFAEGSRPLLRLSIALFAATAAGLMLAGRWCWRRGKRGQEPRGLT